VIARTLPGAASTWVAERVAGPRRRAEVVAQGPHAVYVDVDGECVGVLARDAVALPIGLRTTLPRLPPATGPVEVGDGRLVFEGYDVTPTRIVDPVVPRLGRWSSAAGPLTLVAPDNSLDLPATALQALAAAEASAVLDLLGRGDGLTPVGDDVLAGWLVARHAIGRPAGSVGDAVAAHALDRTTLLSATLLRRAIVGEALPECRDLLLAIRSDAGVDAARDRLLAIGHTSGAGLALGISLALATG
jgi:Protein of unknown function (DUF2877)